MAIGLATGTSLGGLSGGAATARLLVWIGGDATSLSRALSGATGSLTAFQTGATRLGGALTRNVTLPAAAVGATAIKMAADWQAAMARIAGLTPVLEESGHSLDYWGDRLLALSKIVPTAPVELADSFYFAASAGLEASDAFTVVELAAKGAAIGMGSAADISKTLIFAMNAYGPAALNAGEAMDALTAAIIEGTAEPEDMAIALGRLLPIASQAGIEFDKVVASIAALTNIGLPARVAVTSLRALFTSLVSPTQKARQELEAVGISMDELRAAIDAGPTVALEYLQEATEGNLDSLHRIVPQIRGFTALLGLSGDQLERVNDIFEATANSAGKFEKAFEFFEETQSFKFGIALNELRVAAIELGTTMFPIFEALTNVLGDFGAAFSNLPKWAQASVAAFIGLAAVMGPLLKLFGRITNDGVGMFTSFKSGAIAVAAFGVSLGLLAGSFQSIVNGTGGVVSTITTLITAFIAARIALGGLTAMANNFALPFRAMGEAGYKAALGLSSMSAAASTAAAVGIAALVAGIGYLIGAAGNAARETKKLSDELVNLGYAGVLSDTELSRIAESSGGVGEAFRQLAHDAGIAGLTIGKSLPAALREVNYELLDIAKAAQADSFAPHKLEPFIDVLERIQGTTIDASEAFTEAGLRMQDFASTVLNYGSQAGDASTQSAMAQILALSRVQEAIESADRLLPLVTASKIHAFAEEGDALEMLANKYGTDTDFMSSQLQELGLTATDILGSGGEVEDAFANTAGLVDKTTGEIIGNIAQMKQAFLADLPGRIEDLAGSFELFGEIPATVEDSTSTLISNLEKNKAYLAGYAADVRSLLARGLDPEVLGALVQEGPAMVRKFADASAGELGTLEEAYKTSMDLIDAAILAEGQHQVTKGHDMVANFGQSILDQERIPANAAAQLISRVTSAFTAGDLSQAGMGMIESLAKGIGFNSNIPAEAMGRIILNLSTKIGMFDGTPLGAKAVQELAQGIAANTGVPAAAIAKVIQAMVGAANNGNAKIAGTAKNAAMMYQEGFRFGIAPAHAAGAAVAQGTVQGLTAKQAAMRVIGIAHGIHYSNSVGSTSPQAVASGQAVGGGAVAGMSAGGAGAGGVGLSVGNAFVASVYGQVGSAYSAGVALGAAMSAGVEAGSHGSPRYYTYYLGQRIADDYAKGMAKGAKQLKFSPQFKSVSLGAMTANKPNNGANGFTPPVSENHYHFHAADQLTIDRIVDAVSARQAQRTSF